MRYVTGLWVALLFFGPANAEISAAARRSCILSSAMKLPQISGMEIGTAIVKLLDDVKHPGAMVVLIPIKVAGEAMTERFLCGIESGSTVTVAAGVE